MEVEPWDAALFQMLREVRPHDAEAFIRAIQRRRVQEALREASICVDRAALDEASDCLDKAVRFLGAFEEAPRHGSA